MPHEVVSNIYLNYGLVGLVVIGFAMLLVWVLKRNSVREDKLYALIEVLSRDIPEIKSAIERVETKLNR